MANLAYPLEEEAFISYQQAGTGRDLSEGEIELLRLAASYINIVYEVGLSSSAPYSAVMAIFKSNLAEAVKSGKGNDLLVSRFLSLGDKGLSSRLPGC